MTDEVELDGEGLPIPAGADAGDAGLDGLMDMMGIAPPAEEVVEEVVPPAQVETVVEEELTPQEHALIAWSKADPDGFAEYESMMEAKAAAAETPIVEVAKPTNQAPEMSDLEQRAAFRAYERQDANAVAQVNAEYNERIADWESRKSELGQLKKDERFDPTDPAHARLASDVAREQQRLTEHFYNVVQPKNVVVQTYKQIDQELGDYPPLEPHRLLYGQLRFAGILTGAELPQQKIAAINAELAKAGKPLFGQTEAARKESATDRIARIRKAGMAINVSRAGRGAPGAKVVNKVAGDGGNQSEKLEPWQQRTLDNMKAGLKK